jgi:hypothetical protein
MACRVIERASSACWEVARAAAGTIGYNINNRHVLTSECHSSRGPRQPRGSWPHAVRTLRSETLSETPTGVPRKPAASVHRGQPLGSELDSVAQTAVANSQRNENVRGFARTSPIDPARFADPAQTRRRLTIASHASAVVVLGRSPLHTPARLPRLRALARHTPRRSFVRTRRPRLHLGREIPQFAAFERARGFAASLGVRGIAATARRRAGGVRAAYPR